MTTIPASAIVAVTPSVLSAGGSALDLIGLLLSTSPRVPIGSAQAFSTAAAVDEYFGSTSDEAIAAGIYFSGFDNSTVKPGSVLFAQYPLNPVAAYLRGGNISTLTLGQLQALSGTLSIVIDGVLKTAAINLAAATSFSNAASIIGDGLDIHGPQVATFTGSIAGGTLTVSALAAGTIGVGDVLAGTGVTADTFITELLTGTGGAGTYSVTPSQVSLSQAMTAYAPGVTFDSVSGAFLVSGSVTGAASTMAFGSGAMATSLLLTLITGAVLSQGAAAAVPAAFMDAFVIVTQNWATFALLFDPDAGSGNAQKLAFAAWTDDTNQRYAFACWDTDASPAATVPATASLGYLIAQADYSGTILIYAPDSDIAVFVCGAVASIAFGAPNGRTTLKFRSQTGLVAGVTDQTSADNLAANGYNFYGAFATANDQFVFFANGVISGPFSWVDSYVNQIWLNNAFQLALVELLTQALSIPYNAAGRAQIEAAMADPINDGLSFGAFRAGVELSASQKAAVNAAAGVDAATTLQNRGWYLLVGTATPQVRAARGSPPCTFWYVDGQSVQQINLNSIEVE